MAQLTCHLQQPPFDKAGLDLEIFLIIFFNVSYLLGKSDSLKDTSSTGVVPLACYIYHLISSVPGFKNRNKSQFKSSSLVL